MAAIGRVLLMPKGTYSGSAIYNSLDWVRDNGAAWVCKVDGTQGIAPPTLPTTYNANWQLIASDGSVSGTIDWTNVNNKPFATLDSSDFDVDGSNELNIKRGTFGKVRVVSGGSTVDLAASGDSIIQLEAGSNVTLTPDNTTNPKKVTINSTGGGGGSSVTVIDNLTSSSSTDALSANQGRVLKGLVDAINALIPSGASTSNPLATSSDIPTVNNAQLTIQQNGTSKGTFTANQSSDATANIVTDEWFSSGGSVVEYTISTSDTSKTFTGLNANYAYKPFIQVADGEDALPYKSMVFSGTSVTITFDSPSAAQAAGNACKIKLREIK